MASRCDRRKKTVHFVEEDEQSETMSSWLQRQTSSHNAQLVGTALLSGVAVAGAIFGIQALRRQIAVEDLKASIPGFDEKQDMNGVRLSGDLMVHSKRILNSSVKLTDYGAASKIPIPTTEDQRSAALALRAQQEGYDEGIILAKNSIKCIAIDVYQTDLILEQLARNRVFLTDEGLAKLRSAFVVVIGCGGVGSHATSALARSGVSKIRLIDFDQVTLSSLNRHAVATLADVGTPKVLCIKKRLEQVTPWVKLDCRNELFSEMVASLQLEAWDRQRPDYIIDAIDHIDSKVALLKYCHQHSLPVISSMGAGCKSDPTNVFIGDISASIEDPLSRSTRRRLRALGVSEGIPVVYSTEKLGPGKAQLLPLSEEEFVKGKVNELGVLPDFRIRILPVLGTMPAVFGYAAASHVILEVTGYPHEYVPSKGREKMYDSILGNLQNLEERLAKAAGEDPKGLKIPVTKDDVGYLIEEVYKGKSVVSGLPTKLSLVRWQTPEDGFAADKRWEGQKSSRLRLRDLVCMTKEEAAQHEREVLRGGIRVEDMYEKKVLEVVQQRLKEEETYERYR